MNEFRQQWHHYNIVKSTFGIGVDYTTKKQSHSLLIRYRRDIYSLQILLRTICTCNKLSIDVQSSRNSQASTGGKSKRCGKAFRHGIEVVLVFRDTELIRT